MKPLIHYRAQNKNLIEVNAAETNLYLAAPELLEGIKSMYLFISTYGGEVTANFAGKNNENLNYYKNLIAKAEGKGK